MTKNRREQEKTRRRRTDALAVVQEMKESSGGGVPTCVAIPEGWDEFKPEVGTYELDVMDYVAGKYNRRADPEMLHWECEFRQHWISCSDGKTRPYVCSCRYKERCPCCERYQRPQEGDDDKLKRDMRGRVMHLMIVRVLSKDRKPIPDAKFQLWTANNYNRGKGFMEQFMDLLESNEKFKNFSDWEEGCSLRLTCKEESMQGGGSYVYVGRIDFVDRKVQYGQDVEQELICLDDLLVRKSYKQLKNLVEKGEEEPQEDEPKSASPARPNGASYVRPASKNEGDEEEHTLPTFEKGDWVLHEKFGRCQVAEIYRNGQMTLEDKAGREHENVSRAACASLEEDSAPKAPVKNEDKEDKKPAKKNEEEYDDWGDEEKEEEKPKSKGKPSRR